jgi:hypothetical protein
MIARHGRSPEHPVDRVQVQRAVEHVGLIKDDIGRAQVKKVVTDPTTGSTYLDTTQATLAA